MSDLAARSAIEIDRLVLGVNRQVGPRHGRRLMKIARDLGLDSLKLIPHLGDFWLERPVSIELAEARLPYADAGSVADRIAAFESLGLLEVTDHGYRATERFRPLLAASVAARGEVVEMTWSDHALIVSEADRYVTRVVDALRDDHVVATAHRGLGQAPHPLHRFYDRLVTLRYVRQHDHVTAWRARGLDATTISAMTALWHDQHVEPDEPGLRSLESAGLASEGALATAGRQLREEIEDETNERAGASW